jgi:beta-lactamase regulating signal transducer with metallopeptidase domain
VTSFDAVVLTFLVNALWQAPVLALAGWVGARLLGSAPAAYRHRLWMAALALSVLLPTVSALSPPSRQRVRPASGPGFTMLGAFDAARSPAAASGALSFPLSPSLGGPGRIAALLYLAFVLAGALRLVRGIRLTAGLAARSETAPPSLLRLATEWVGAGRIAPDVRVSAHIGTPITFGLRRPVIVFPLSFATNAAAESLRGAFAHELGHVARHDCALNLACAIASVPLAFHPAVCFLKRRLMGAREAACDEAAAAVVGRERYARTLIEVAAACCHGPRLTGALGVLDGDNLEERMKRILSGRRLMRGGKATLVLTGLLLAMAAAGRMALAAAVAVNTEAGPSDMVGRWTAAIPEGPAKGRPAAELNISLGATGPDIALTLYRYRADDPERKPEADRPPVVQHGVKDGVLSFRTRVEKFQVRSEDPPAPMEADWQFAVVGADAGELKLVRSSLAEADKAKGRAVPPPPPPLPMKRVAKTSTPQ